jgi:hypothetical protein
VEAALAAPALSISDAQILEANSGTNLLGFVVTLSAASTDTVSVNYVTFNGTAVSSSDYVSKSGVITFVPGMTTQTIEVGVRGDSLFETNENFNVGLNSPVNALITRNIGIGTILNDDPPPLVSIDDASVAKANSGTNNLMFQVRLSAPTGLRILVYYLTSDGTATGGTDYFRTNGVLSFSANSLTLTQTINVPVIGGSSFEPDKLLYVNVTSISNALAGKVHALGTIIGDVAAISPPSSDAFATRTILDSAPHLKVIGASNTNATKEPFEPDHGGNPGGKSVWWSWRAPASGTAMIDTLGSGFDTLVAVYTGSSLTSLSLVASNDNAAAGESGSLCAFNILSNSVYAIAVDGKNGAAGSVVLRINVRPDEFIISSDPRDDFVVTGNGVFSLFETNNVLYVGGGIRNFGRPKRVGALIRPSGELDPHLPRIVGSIFSVISDDEGGWYVGGQFTSVGNVPRTNLVHLFSDLSVDPLWKPELNDAVIALALSEGTLYVSGNFTMVSGELRLGLAALTASNGVPTEWDPFLIDPVVNGVNCMVVTSNSVYVGGWFWRVGSQFRENIAELDRITGLATDWDPGAAEYTGFGVTSLAVSETHVYASGAFTQLSGEDRHYLGSIDRKTGLASSWNPSPDFFVWALALNCNTLYAGGAFGQIAGQSKTRLAAFDVGSGVLLDWNPGPIDNEIGSLALSGRTLHVGGWFTTIGGASRRYIAALDLQSGRATDWAPPVSLPLTGLAVQSGTVFAALNGQAAYRRHVAAIDASTGEVLPWNADVRSEHRLEQPIRCMAMAGDTLYLGGSFTNVAGQTRNGLAAVDAATGALKEWDANLGPSYVSVNAMNVVSNTLYIGGEFTSVSGALCTNLAAIDLTTGLATSWAPDTYGAVFTLSRRGTNLFFGGDTSKNGFIPSILRVSGVSLATDLTDLAFSFHAILYGVSARHAGPSVQTITADANAVYVGGSFEGVAFPDPSVSRNNLAAFDPTTSAATGWNPDVDGPVFGLAQTSRSILVGGDFNRIGAAERNFVGEIETTTGRPTGWHPEPNLWVRTIVARKNAYYLGGAFWTVNGRDCPGLAVFPPEGAPRITIQPDDVLIPANDTLALKAKVGGQEPLFHQWRRSGTNIPGATAAQLVVANAQPSDSGTYDLRVTNGLGLITSLEVIATVYEAPVITLQPISQTALLGVSATFTAAATGAPTPRFQWRLNGANIPGATGPTLTIANVQYTNGGSYSVAVANVGGGQISDVATLLVQGASGGLVDNFDDANANFSMASSGVRTGSNATATGEPGEPLHADKPGGKSVWFAWVAPAKGIATFSTRGSSFDTLLAVYTGAALNNLQKILFDEDRGGFFTSTATFNAVAGTAYLIAVDGLAGGSGNIVLSWDFDATAVEFPRITGQPPSRTVARGGTTEFTVLVNSDTPASYQWFRGCDAIAGATNAMLIVANVQRRNLGSYRVVVMNSSTRVAESEEAFLEIGPSAQTYSHDKFEDLLLTLGAGNPLFNKAVVQALAATSGFISVSAGSVGSQLMKNIGSTSQSGDPLLCGAAIGGASRWFGLQATVSGKFLLDTIGSKIDTVLAVFEGPDFAHLTRVACDDNGAPDRIRSRLSYPGTAGTPYFVLVDGVNGAQGDIALNWRLEIPPGILPPPNYPHPRQGESIVLSAVVSNSTPDLIYQWQRNGIDIFGATNTSLNLLNIEAAQSGTYSLVLSNFAGFVTNAVAMVNVAVPIQLTYQVETVNGQSQFRIIGPTAVSFTIDASSDLVTWLAIHTNDVTVAPINYLDTSSTNLPQRFYRAMPWP